MSVAWGSARLMWVSCSNGCLNKPSRTLPLGPAGARMREAISINSGLLVLQKVRAPSHAPVWPAHALGRVAPHSILSRLLVPQMVTVLA